MTRKAGMVGGQKPFGADGRAISVFGFELRESDRPLLACASSFGAIGQDLEQPGLHGRATLESTYTRQHSQPGLLNHLFGHGID